MVNLASKRIFLIDLDDTLINTTDANEMALKRTYRKLASECEENLSEVISETKFVEQVEGIYRNEKDEHGKKFFDYEAEVFEKYCNEKLPTYKLPFRHIEHSLAARLFWQFKETKNACLMGREDAFELLNTLRKRGAVYCITQGKCNYQHTKTMLTDIEPKLNGVSVTTDKETELPKYVDAMKFQKELAVMIGDKPSDAKAGKNAGIDTIRIVYPRRSDDDFSTAQPDASFASLGEFLRAIQKA